MSHHQCWWKTVSKPGVTKLVFRRPLHETCPRNFGCLRMASPIGKPKQLPQDSASFLRCFGFEGGRRNNLVYIEADTLIHTCGNYVQFLNLNTMTQTNLPNVGGDGVGCVAVHPSKTVFAVCEKGNRPNVYIYNYPSLTIFKVLKQGTEKIYTAAAFNSDGSQLATVGGHPDYWLTVWDWNNETIVLQSKAFSQEIFQVSFSRYFPGQLLTAGIGHIRFWKMANTFTGPKLEGLIGKFGQVPLSDICAYLELPDGKVLSGTETGTILVWDGGLIKCQLRRPGGRSCHDGMIEFLQLDEKENEMLSAGADGCVRFWSLEWLDAAADGDEKTVCEVNPLRELQVDERCSIKGIIIGEDHWLIQDENGALWKVHVPSFDVGKVLEFHAGTITGLSVSPNSYFLATAGSDSSVRLFHFNEKKQVYARWFSSGATSILWPSTMVDPLCQTVVVGFADGVIRVLSKGHSQWRLKNSKKPHVVNVTALSFTVDGEILATSSLDATVFFFHSSKEYQPLGFMKAPGPVTCIDWSPSGANLLLGCSNGKILEVARPGYDTNTKLTFELNLPSKLYTFVLPEIRDLCQSVSNDNESSENKVLSEDGESEMQIPRTEDEISQEGNNAVTLAETSDVNQDKEVRNDTQCNEDYAENQQKELGNLNDGSATTKDAIGLSEQPDSVLTTSSVDHNVQRDENIEKDKEIVLPVRALLYTNSVLNTFYIALEGNAAGFIFECHIDMKGVMGIASWHSMPLRCLRYSESRQYLISGHDDGIIRAQTAPTPGQLSIMQNHVFWEGRIHDGFNGAVSGAMLSFDHQYLASTAHDGSFYIHELKFEKSPLSSIAEDRVKADQGAEEIEAEDIGIGVYSIEEDKQKTEQENKERMAWQKKEKLKGRVDSICKTLADLMKENNEREPTERLPLEDFEIDPSLRSMIEEEIQTKAAEVKQELEWDSEKKSIALSKLRRKFLDPLEVERIVLHSFLTGISVATFRTLKIREDVQMAIADANAQKEHPPAPRVSVLTLLKDPQKIPEEEQSLAKIEGAKIEQMQIEDQDSAALQNMRRLQLKKMVADYDAFVQRKNATNFENEDDIAAIRYAETNMGDFKLKSDLAHVPPKKQQTNARKKRNEMLLLKEAIFKEKMKFNKNFLALREIKRKICKKIEEKNNRIQQINGILRIKDEPLYVPCQFKDESPEDREIVTDKDIEEHCERLRKQEELQKEKKVMNFGGFSTKAKQEEKDIHSNSKSTLGSIEELRRKEIDKPSVTAQLRTFPLSALEQEEQDAMQIKLKFEKSRLLNEIESMIHLFDCALQELRRRKFQLEINIKRSDLKMICLYQELKLLKNLQPKEEVLESRQAAKSAELTDICGKIVEQDKLLEMKKGELNALNEKKKQLMEEFEGLLGENNPSREALMKIYLKKIRLSKNTDDEENDDLEEDVDVDDTKGSEDDFDEDEVVEVCPTGCEPDLYQKVCKLRERRTVEDTLLQEGSKQLDALQRDKESKIKKKKAMETALTNLGKEMEDFQKEKQNGLNQIEAVLTLYMHQIEYLADGMLPDDFSGAVVFSNTVINELKETIKEHGSETSSLRRLQKELKKEHTSLVRERKCRENNVGELEQRVIDVQMLKFGQVIDLEVVDAMNMKKESEELKMQLRAQEAQNAIELAKWNKMIDESIDEIAKAMKEHAACLNVTADIKENLRNLNQKMKQKASTPYKDLLVEKKRKEEQYVQLCKIVGKNEEHIKKLKQDLKAIQKERRKLFP